MEVTAENIFGLFEDLNNTFVGVFQEKQEENGKITRRFYHVYEDFLGIEKSKTEFHGDLEGFEWRAVELTFRRQNKLVNELVDWVQYAPNKDRQGLMWSIFQYWETVDEPRRHSLIGESWVSSKIIENYD
jgi:hypothetical protein